MNNLNLSSLSLTDTKDVAVPIDFTNPWDLSDVALKLKDSDSLLYANKSVLSVHSGFFKSIFFSGSTDAKQEVVSVNISYWAMWTILSIIHHMGKRFGEDERPLIPDDKLVLLYQAGDHCDIDLIRQLCRKEISRLAPSTALEAFIILGLSQEKTDMLRAMNFSDIEICLKKHIPGSVLSMEDARILLEKSKEVEKRKIRCPRCGSTGLVNGKVDDMLTRYCHPCDRHFRLTLWM